MKDLKSALEAILFAAGDLKVNVNHRGVIANISVRADLQPLDGFKISITIQIIRL